MSVVVVAGSSRNVGKTGVMAGLISGLRELEWVAVKITPHAHGELAGDFACVEEFARGAGTDTSRYLDAGASRAYLLRVREGYLGEATGVLQELIAGASHVVIESTSVLEFLKPDVALCVVDASVEEVKASALRYADRMDALVWVGDGVMSTAVLNFLSRLDGARELRVVRPEYMSAELMEYVAQMAKVWK